MESAVTLVSGLRARVTKSARLSLGGGGVRNQIPLFIQCVAFFLPLPAIRIRIRPFLNLVAGKRIRGVARARGILGLMDVASFRRDKPLLLAIEVEVAFGQGDAGDASQFGVDVQQQGNVLLD